jgi:hypothetical protein
VLYVPVGRNDPVRSNERALLRRERHDPTTELRLGEAGAMWIVRRSWVFIRRDEAGELRYGPLRLAMMGIGLE